jgi:hypothetical protein
MEDLIMLTTIFTGGILEDTKKGRYVNRIIDASDVMQVE